MSIIREHGGNIEAEILPGGGSAFTIYLPSAPVETPSTASETMRPAARAAQGRGYSFWTTKKACACFFKKVSRLTDCVLTVLQRSTRLLPISGVSSYDVLLCDLHLSAMALR